MNIEKILDQQLRKAGLKMKTIRSEMLDHYMERYELLIDSGLDHKKAESIVIKEITEMNMRKLNSDIFKIHYQNNIMISLVFFLLFSVLSISFNVPDSHEPPNIWPIAQGDISSHFGMKVHPIKKEKMMHKGIDIKAELGTDVVAPSDGEVIESSYDNEKGHYLIIKHDEIYMTKYYHLSKRMVKKGDKVKQEQQIGKVGTSGMSTGPHLHYEVLKSGVVVDPIHYLKV